MTLLRHLCLACCFIALVFITVPAMSEPSLTPTVTVGDTSLSGSGNGTPVFHEFFTQAAPSDWKGDITGFADDDTFWVYVIGIDATALTGVQGRRVKFNLQDAETGSSFKHLGISFSLDNPDAGGGDLLECYQSSGDGLSTHGLVPGELTRDNFDLRFSFTRAAGQAWTVAPYFRMEGGSWESFFDGNFTADIPFNFLGAKMVVALDNPVGAASNGTVSFSNFFVLGPIFPPFDNAYVDDDWAAHVKGDAVQFPGQEDIQIIGLNAFSKIQDGIDLFQSDSSAKSVVNSLNSPVPLNQVSVAAGSYYENLNIRTHLLIDGAGSGANPDSNSVVHSVQPNTPVVFIEGPLASGTSFEHQFSMRDLRLTGATGEYADGIHISDQQMVGEPMKAGSNPQLQDAWPTAYMEFENIAAVENAGNGISFDSYGGGQVEHITIRNCTLSTNLYNGLHVPSTLSGFYDFHLIGGEIKNNDHHGLSIESAGPGAVDSVMIDSTAFAGNGSDSFAQTAGNGGEATVDLTMSISFADLRLQIFDGDLFIRNISVVGDGGGNRGLAIVGQNNMMPYIGDDSPATLNGVNGVKMVQPVAGTIVLDDISISGTYANFEATTGAGLYISGLSGVDTVSFTDVNINVLSATGPVMNLYNYDISGTLNIGNMVLGGNATRDIWNAAPALVDARSATFTGAVDGFAIEDRVDHAIDFEGWGLVRWLEANLFVTPASFTLYDSLGASINRAAIVSASGDTIRLDQGTFSDGPQTVFPHHLVLLGSGKATTTVGPRFSTGSSGDSQGWFLVPPGANLEVHDITFDATGRNVHQAFRILGSGSFTNVCFNEIKFQGDYDEGTAILAGGTGPVHLSSSTFTEIGRTGVYYTGPGVSGSIFRDSQYTGKGAGSYLDYAAEVDSGANVTFIKNTISNNLGLVEYDGTWESAGFLISTATNEGTIVTVDSTNISNSANGIQVGLGTSDDSFVIVRNCSLMTNQTGILVKSALFIKPEKNYFYGNSLALYIQHATVFDLDSDRILNNGSGILVSNSFGEIDQSIISGNDGVGIWIRDQASTGVTIHRNEFCNNSVGLVNDGSSQIDAIMNWWGASDGPGGDGGGTGDSISGAINFSNFETDNLFVNSPCGDDAACVANGDVNNDGSITPGDAFCAFDVFLNGQNVPGDCDVDGFDCEIRAADANCDNSVTPGDAFAIFQAFLDGAPPAQCLDSEKNLVVENGQAAAAFGISFEQNRIKEAGAEGGFELELYVDGSTELNAFGFNLNYPESAVEFVRVEPSEDTADLSHLDAVRTDDGTITIGGFCEKPMSVEKGSSLIKLVFSYKKQTTGEFELSVTDLVDDFRNVAISEVLTFGGALPTTFSLHQNFPNPFNPETQIRYDIPETSTDKLRVSLAIYNIRGQLIRQLVDEKKAAGAYRVVWDGRNDQSRRVATGTYFYTIKAGSFKETKKMLMLK